jgi:hypothetical protein
MKRFLEKDGLHHIRTFRPPIVALAAVRVAEISKVFFPLLLGPAIAAYQGGAVTVATFVSQKINHRRVVGFSVVVIIDEIGNHVCSPLQICLGIIRSADDKNSKRAGNMFTARE